MRLLYIIFAVLAVSDAVDTPAPTPALVMAPPDGSDIPQTTAAPTPALSLRPPDGSETAAPTPFLTVAPTSASALTPSPTSLITSEPPTPVPTPYPTPLPTTYPTPYPTAIPTVYPTPAPTSMPTPTPTALPTFTPTPGPTGLPTSSPSPYPTSTPTPAPTGAPTSSPTLSPTPYPTPKPSPEPPIYVALNLTFTVRNVDTDAAFFNADYMSQGVIKDALSMSLHTVTRQDVMRVSATDGYSPTVVVLHVLVMAQLQKSGYNTATDLFNAIITEFQADVNDGTLARNVQKAAVTSAVSSLATAIIDSDSFHAPTTFSVNGQVTTAVPKAIEPMKSEALPLSVVLPSMVAGLLVFAAMFYYSRARVENFRTPEDPLAVLATAAAAARGHQPPPPEAQGGIPSMEVDDDEDEEEGGGGGGGGGGGPTI